MQIRVGFEMEYQCPGPTPMILALNIHYSRASDLVRPDYLVTHPAVPVAPKSEVLLLPRAADQKLASAIVASRAQVRRSEAT